MFLAFCIIFTLFLYFSPERCKMRQESNFWVLMTNVFSKHFQNCRKTFDARSLDGSWSFNGWKILAEIWCMVSLLQYAMLLFPHLSNATFYNFFSGRMASSSMKWLRWRSSRTPDYLMKVFSTILASKNALWRGHWVVRIFGLFFGFTSCLGEQNTC